MSHLTEKFGIVRNCSSMLLKTLEFFNGWNDSKCLAVSILPCATEIKTCKKYNFLAFYSIKINYFSMF
jgi:hypothetical protein